jgi:hypothetical protein
VGLGVAKNVETELSAAATRIIVDPVPCRPELLLKFETRISPAFSGPPSDWKFRVMKATPYGFKSPFVGTVETICGLGKNERDLLLARKPAGRTAKIAVSKRSDFRFIWLLGFFMIWTSDI